MKLTETRMESWTTERYVILVVHPLPLPSPVQCQHNRKSLICTTSTAPHATVAKGFPPPPTLCALFSLTRAHHPLLSATFVLQFWYVLESVQLNLNLSAEEIAEIRKLAEADGPLPPIAYEQFVPMFRSLLNRVYDLFCFVFSLS